MNQTLGTRRQAFAAERVYIDLDKAGAPEWAKGCDNCKFGVIRHIDYSHSPLPLYEMLPLLAAVYLVEFCDCQAGEVARQNARSMYARMRDGNMLESEAARVRQWVEGMTA
jgi:hypothetical protein